MTSTVDIVAKLWSLCHVLRDDGVTYNEYVTELTFLLFLKMLEETGKESRLPKSYRWGGLAKREGLDQLDYYKQLLLDLGKPDTRDGLVRAIFIDAQTKLRKPTNLKSLTSSIDQLDWFSAREEGLGNLYEGLLEKNAADKKSGAGQYFTPRPLIDCIVRLMKPQPGETVQDPAAGTAGFLVAADRYIKDHTDDLYKLPEQQAFFQRHNAFAGAELVPDTHRLCLMNLLLHGIEGGVELADTLSPDGERLPKADLLLTNPPFGTKKGGGRPTRSDFSVTADTSNKQLAFVEHIVRALKPGGRAAVVVPDNVLFEDNTGRRLRTWLMELCNLHTILRLPTGIFYAQGVKTNVLFFQRGGADKANTKAVWVYDLRANMPAFGKTRPLTVADFAEFEKAYGDNPNGSAKRKDRGEDGRWRSFTREQIKTRNDNLDIAWLRDTEAEAEEQLTEIDSLSAKSKLARDHVDHIPRLVRKYKQAVLSAAFRGGLTREWRTNRGLVEAEPISAEIDTPYRQSFTAPSSWRLSRFEAVCTIEGGGQPPKSTFEYAPDAHLIRFVQIRDYKSDDRITFIPRRLARRFCSVDDIMIGRYGPPIFQILRGIEGAYNVALMKAVPNSSVIEREYLFKYLNHPDLRAYVEFEAQRTAGQDGVNKRHLLAWPILLPPMDEQNEIVRRIDRMMTWIDRLASEAMCARKLIDRLDRTILTKAFRGELVPQDSNDEPASVLLDRIQVERNVAPERKRQRTRLNGNKKRPQDTPNGSR